MWNYVLREHAALRRAYRPRRGAERAAEVFDLDQLAGKLGVTSLADLMRLPHAHRGLWRRSQRAWEPSPSSLLS